MTTIFLGDEDAHAIEKVRELAAWTELHDLAFSGGSISVELGDYTSVEARDEYAGATLLAAVHHLLDEIAGRVPEYTHDDDDETA